MSNPFFDTLNKGLENTVIPMAGRDLLAQEESKRNLDLLLGKTGMESFLHSGNPAALEMAKNNLSRLNPNADINLSGLSPSIDIQEKIRTAEAGQKIRDSLAKISRGETIAAPPLDFAGDTSTGDLDRLSQDWNKTATVVPGRQPTLMDVINLSMQHDPTGTASLKLGMQQATLDSMKDKLEFMAKVGQGHDTARILAALLANDARRYAADKKAGTPKQLNASQVKQIGSDALNMFIAENPDIQQRISKQEMGIKNEPGLMDKAASFFGGSGDPGFIKYTKDMKGAYRNDMALTPEQKQNLQKVIDRASQYMAANVETDSRSATKRAIDDIKKGNMSTIETQNTGGGGSSDFSSLFNGLIQTESNWDPGAISPKGAIGLTQLMPGTAADLGVDPYNPQQNIEGGKRYLQQMLTRYGGDQTKALAAYNWGPGNVDRLVRQGRFSIENLPRETQAYIAKVAKNATNTPKRSLDSFRLD